MDRDRVDSRQYEQHSRLTEPFRFAYDPPAIRCGREVAADLAAELAAHDLDYLFDRVDGRRDMLAETLGVADADDPARAVVAAVVEVRDELGLPARLRDVPGPDREELPSVAEAVLADRLLANVPAGLDPTVEDIEAPCGQSDTPGTGFCRLLRQRGYAQATSARSGALPRRAGGLRGCGLACLPRTCVYHHGLHDRCHARRHRRVGMIDAVVFDAGTVESHDDAAAAKAAEGTTWVRATGATPAELDRVADAFDLHPLTVEDVHNDVRPKTEEFSEYSFTLVKDAELRRGERTFEEEIDDEAVGIYLGEDWLVTLALAEVPAIDRVWESLLDEDRRLLQRGVDFVAYRVVDRLVDEYFEILDEIETQIETIEEEVLVSTEIETLERINSVRRDLLAFRKIAWPTREAVTLLARGDPPFVAQETEKYYRDVADHLVQVVDLIETYRDLTNGARDIYLNTLSQSTNEVMKTLTLVATIFIPLTFVVGVYGMNFADSPFNMPELGWTFGYPAVLVGMALIAAIVLVHFRRRGWL
ncbi:MAG: magnesium transporter [Haloarculaceae archaeon]|jgi:magnesium transporter